MTKKSLRFISFIIVFLITSIIIVGGFFSSPLSLPPLSAGETKALPKQGKLVIAIKDNLPPLAFKDSTGNLQGLEIDIARRLAQELTGTPEEIEFVPVANQDRLSVILDGKVDFTIARVTATETRGRLVEFSIPYYLDGAGFITKEPAVMRLEQVQKKPIAVLNNSDTIANVKYFLPNAKLIGVNSYIEAKNLLETGKAAAFAADVSVLTGWVREDAKYHILPVLLTAEPLCIVMPKGLQYANLRLQVNYAIQGWKAEGWLQERLKYWQLPVPNE